MDIQIPRPQVWAKEESWTQTKVSMAILFYGGDAMAAPCASGGVRTSVRSMNNSLSPNTRRMQPRQTKRRVTATVERSSITTENANSKPWLVRAMVIRCSCNELRSVACGLKSLGWVGKTENGSAVVVLGVLSSPVASPLSQDYVSCDRGTRGAQSLRRGALEIAQ